MNRKNRRAGVIGNNPRKEVKRLLGDMMKGTSVMKDMNTDAFDKLMRPEGEIIPVPYEEVLKFSIEERRLWMHKNGVYQLITTELVEFLQPLVQSGPAVEICAGAGVLGKALNIDCVDNHLQNRPDMKAQYQAAGQPIIPYGEHVINAEATKWVQENEPEIVIASWLTEKREGGMSIGAIEGPDEDAIFDVAKVYVHIGNENPHGLKKVLSIPHRVIQAPWLISRNADQSLNKIWIFGNWNPKV